MYKRSEFSEKNQLRQKMLKKLFSILTLLVSMNVLSQTVIIPDPNFKQCLVERHATLLDENRT